MNIIRAASEPEVIAEFLRGEYHQKEYHRDRADYERLVLEPDLQDDRQNRLRRDLLFRRHRVIWSDLPPNVEWRVAKLEPDDITRIRVFPRGHWPKMANGNPLTVQGLAESIRAGHFAESTIEDVSSIQALAYRMRQSSNEGSVVLIGVNEALPLTVLEGNHRLIAAALVSSEKISSFTAFCGFSARMHECFWYQNRGRHALLRHVFRRAKHLQPRLVTAMRNLAGTLVPE